MSSAISICNQALSEVGGNQIMSFDDNTNEGIMCKLHYDAKRDIVTQAHEWSFARTRLVLAPLAETPEWGFEFQYQLPSYILATFLVTQDPVTGYPLDDWSVEDNKILCNVGDVIYTRNVRRVTNTSKFTPLFTEAFVARLAAELAIPIAESRPLYETLMKVYQAKIDEAAAVDGIQGRTMRTYGGRLQRARWARGPQYAGRAG